MNKQRLTPVLALAWRLPLRSAPPTAPTAAHCPLLPFLLLPSPGQFFGFPFCHTGPTGGNIDDRPYLRLPGAGPQLVDPDLNAGESVMACNGEGWLRGEGGLEVWERRAP